jgi:5'-nucleotidase
MPELERWTWMTRTTLILMLPFLVVAMAGSLWAQEGRWPRRVLLTNDDGLADDGLMALARAFAPIAETYVVAPLENRSGSSSYVAAIGRRELVLERRDLGMNVTAYGVDGYPADAVTFALTTLLADRPPDLVISGINGGPNLSDDAYLSGTIGAARIAALFGVPAIAVSGHNGEPETLAALARWVVELASSDLVRGLEPRGYLTVSFPRVTAAEIEGVDIVRRGPRTWKFEFDRDSQASDPGREIWRLSIVGQSVITEAGTDVHSYEHNRIAIVPMRVDDHDYQLLERLRSAGNVVPEWPPIGGQR